MLTYLKKLLFSNAAYMRCDKSLFLYTYITMCILFCFSLCNDFDSSLMNINFYLSKTLNVHNKTHVFLILIINFFMFAIVNKYIIFVLILMFFNTEFLLLNFINKHRTYNFAFRNLDIQKVVSILFKRVIAFPLIYIVMFTVYSWLMEFNLYNLIILVYITQLPLSYINNLSTQIYAKFINLNTFNYEVINSKLYIKKNIFTIDFRLYNINVINGINIYSLFIRLFTIFILNMTPILFVVFFLFIGLTFTLYKYNIVNFTPGPSPILKGKPVQSSITQSTAATLGLGTILWSSIDSCNTQDPNVINSPEIEPSKSLEIVRYSNIGKRTLFNTVGGQTDTNIDYDNLSLIRKSKILKLLQKINLDTDTFFDESVEREWISTNLQDNMVLAYKKYNEQTSCGVIYRSDIDSNYYYPSYYTNKEAVSNLKQYLYNKFQINCHGSNDLIIFSQRISLGGSMHKVWRLSPEYDSFLHKLEKHWPKSTTFTLPEEGTHKISNHNTHFDSLEVVNSLNDCLHESKKHFFSLEAHYSTVFTEYLHYAKPPTQLLSGEHYISATKIDFLIRHKVNGRFWGHTYVERKPPLDQEHMYECRNQSLRYIIIDSPWPQGIEAVYGLNCLGLNIEFNEYRIGSKGLINLEEKHKDQANKDIEIYSIVSEDDSIDKELDYSFKIGRRTVRGTENFRLYKEYGSLDNTSDSEFINKCRIYQLNYY